MSVKTFFRRKFSRVQNKTCDHDWYQVNRTATTVRVRCRKCMAKTTIPTPREVQ